jgi:hypothetical protein
MNVIRKMGVALALTLCVVRPCPAQVRSGLADAAPDTLAASETTDLSKLLPASDEIPLWRLDGEPLTYTEDDLWEYIDGAADNFLAFEFRRVIAQDYVSDAGEGLKVEIYEHSNPLMAYGIYAQMRNPGLTFQRIGNEAFSDEYSMNFWKNRFFVRIAVFEPGDALHGALESFANAIAAKIEEGAALPAEATVFPEEGLVPNDTRYLTTGVLGREDFPPAFVARYRLGEEEAKLYLSTLSDSAAARDTLDWYLSHMTSFQPVSGGPNDEYVIGIASDPFQGDELVFRFRRFVGVLTGLEKPAESGLDLVKRTVERLEELDAASGGSAPPRR